jgi:hypothetical protein
VKNHRRATFVLALAILLSWILSGSSSVQLAQTNGLPPQLTDQEFWKLVTDISEPSGPYTGDNWISNEASIQDIIPHLRKLSKQNGAYLGVGPEQNFTYMWAMQSKMGFIIDIRRQNMLEILMLKSLFELSPTRADFVANLFSKRRPEGLDASTSAKALMTAFEKAPSDGLAKNVESVKATLANHGFTLSAADLQRISYVQEIFNRAGLGIVAEYASPGSPGGIPVTFVDLMTATDRTGQQWSFLSSEAAYQYIKELHRKNLIVPLVGDFAGPSAIRKVGDYLKQRNANVSTFYLSNVEGYLNGPTMKAFQANLATLPFDSSSMLIRWVPRPQIPNVPWFTPDMGIVATTLAPAAEFVDLIKANHAPTDYPTLMRGTIDPNLLVNSRHDPSLRKVSGRVTGITGLQAFDAVRVELVDGIRAGGIILTADVASDGSFEVRNVSPKTYQAIVLKSCKGCNSSKIVGAPVNVVVADKDLTDVRLTFVAQ